VDAVVHVILSSPLIRMRPVFWSDVNDEDVSNRCEEVVVG
jgi:hypothetical protein